MQVLRIACFTTTKGDRVPAGTAISGFRSLANRVYVVFKFCALGLGQSLLFGRLGLDCFLCPLVTGIAAAKLALLFALRVIDLIAVMNIAKLFVGTGPVTILIAMQFDMFVRIIVTAIITHKIITAGTGV